MAAFDEERRRLLDLFAVWGGEPESAESAGFALDYKRAIDDHRLTHWIHDDIDDLLLGFLPARVFVADDEADEVLDSIARFFEFLGAEGHLHPRSDSAADLAAHVRQHRDEFREMMADPATGGHAKRLLMAMRADGVALDDNRAVEAWMEDFNAGPLARREAILGPAPGPDDYHDDWEPIYLPPRPPVDEELARDSAAESPLLNKILALADYMGEGRPLTATGNLKLADARDLVELLDTPDHPDYEIGGKQHRVRSAVQLFWLDMIVWIAREVRAVKVQKNRMSATKAWRPRGEGHPLEAAKEIASILVDAGPLSILFDDRVSFDGVRTVIDTSAVALLAGLYEGSRRVDDAVAVLIEGIPSLVPLPDWYHHPGGEIDYLRKSIEGDVERLVRVLEWAGLLTWTGYRLVSDRWDLFERRIGGTMALTLFGHWFVQVPLANEGKVVAPTVTPFTATLDDPPEEIVAALAGRLGAGPFALVDAWRQLGGYEGLPGLLWRVDSPDTGPVLEALGKVLEDRATAKAARRAHLKHQSWMAGRR
jgi:hypothetical protein